VDPLNCKEEEALDIVTPCAWLERNSMEDFFKIILYANKAMKDSTLHEQGFTVKTTKGYSMPCIKKCYQLHITWEKYE
ncbi:hypothetical protein KI387_036823, partial [Taxus chinensis]